MILILLNKKLFLDIVNKGRTNNECLRAYTAQRVIIIMITLLKHKVYVRNISDLSPYTVTIKLYLNSFSQCRSLDEEADL